MKLSNSQSVNFQAALGKRHIHRLYDNNGVVWTKATQVIHPFKDEFISEEQKAKLTDRYTKELKDTVDGEGKKVSTEVCFKEELPFSEKEFRTSCKKPSFLRKKEINDFINNKCGILVQTQSHSECKNFPLVKPQSTYTKSKVDCIV